MTEFKTRILVADDDRRAGESVRALIEVHGHEVTLVSDGAEASAEL